MRVPKKELDQCQLDVTIKSPPNVFQSLPPTNGFMVGDQGNRNAHWRFKHVQDRMDGSRVTQQVFSHLSCVHHEVPQRFTSCLVLLDNLFCVELKDLGGGEVNQPHRSTFSLRLCASKQTVKKGIRHSASLGRDDRWPKPSSKPKKATGLHTQMKTRKADESRLSTRSHFQVKQPLSTGSEDDAVQVKPAGRDRQVERQGQVSTLEWKCYYHSGSKSNSPEGSAATLTLQEALELFRPDFISRSQGRLRRMEWRARKRRALQTSTVELMQVLKEEPGKLKKCTTPDPLSDNLFKPRERSISGREMQLRSRRIYNLLPEVTKKKQEERRKAVTQTNRLRAEVYKKKLLDQILQR